MYGMYSMKDSYKKNMFNDVAFMTNMLHVDQYFV